MDTLRFLDILGFIVGLVYIYLEYRASIWLWIAGIIMPAIDMVLYYKAGLYADFGLAIYYCLAAIYGFVAWKKKPAHSPSPREGLQADLSAEKVTELPSLGEGEGVGPGVAHFPLRLVLPSAVVLVAIWVFIWWVLVSFTNSTVPVTDAFTTALSIMALWALARKYAEQWLLWFVVDAVCCVLYVQKGIPFKAVIYGLYTVIAVLGYVKWLKMMTKQ